MDTERYFTELSRMLGKNGIETAPPERNTLPVSLNGHSACRVGPSGELCKFPGDLDSPAASDLYFKVAPISRMVKEYMTVVEQSLLLEATALDEEFRLLAEFNGAVLAGRETQYVEVVVGASGDAKTAVENYLKGDLKTTGSVCHEHQHHDECGE